MKQSGYIIVYDENGQPYIAHHGIKGQKWGVRRFQNPDGSYTEAGRERYGIGDGDASNDETFDRRKVDQEIKRLDRSPDAISRELLEKNPNAAVVDPSLKEWAKAHKKELMIAGGVALAAGGIAISVYVAKNSGVSLKDVLNSNQTADNFVKDIADIKVADVDVPNVRKVADYGGFDSNEKRFIAQWLKADMHRYDAITLDEYKNMSDEGVTLQAGAELFRMSKGEHNNLRDGIEYVSFGDDRERYLGFLPQMWRANGAQNKEFFEASLKAIGEVKAPGKKESVDILIECFRKQYPGISDKIIQAMAFKNFYKVQANIIDRDYALGKLFLNEAKQRGYNAIIDWNDAGRLTDKPLILMNGARQATVQGVKKYNLKETREVFKNIKLPSNVANFTIDDFNQEPMSWLYTPYINIYTA